MKRNWFKIFLLLCICSTGFDSMAQNLSGIWRGHFGGGNSELLEMLTGEGRYKFEVQLDQTAKKFTGVTYSYRTTVFYGKATCEGTINPQTKKVFLDELKIVEVRMAGGEACIMRCWLQYSKVGDEEFLEGKYSSMNIKDSSSCGNGTIFLRKVPTTDFYKEPFLIAKEKTSANKKPPLAKANPPAAKKTTPPIVKKPATPPVKKPGSPVVKRTTPPTAKKTSPAATTPKSQPTTEKVVIKKPPPPKTAGSPKVVIIDTFRNLEKKVEVPIRIPKVLTSRQNELVKTITTNAREISINIYDNGSIDNDTISVYLDKKLVVNRQRLTAKAITVKFELDDEGKEHELIMVAENLGEIPPNTSLMVVRAGTKQYEVRITSTEQKNAVVVFRYEEEKP